MPAQEQIHISDALSRSHDCNEWVALGSLNFLGFWISADMDFSEVKEIWCVLNLYTLG